MYNNIKLITGIITKRFNENLTKLTEKSKDISKFILKIQDELNEVRKHLVVVAL